MMDDLFTFEGIGPLQEDNIEVFKKQVREKFYPLGVLYDLADLGWQPLFELFDEHFNYDRRYSFYKNRMKGPFFRLAHPWESPDFPRLEYLNYCLDILQER